MAPKHSDGAARPVFFIDRSLGKTDVASALAKAGCKVEIHDRHFAQDARDEEWIPITAKRGWVILTKDAAIRRRALEREALINSGAQVFILTRGNLKGIEMARIFVSALPAMRKLLDRAAAAFIATISKTGHVSVLYPARAARRRLKR